jgi:hypothetical protein
MTVLLAHPGPEVGDTLAPGARRAWTCPHCGHGSPEPRDEAAHLDAHRQLQALFDAWDARIAPDGSTLPAAAAAHGRSALSEWLVRATTSMAVLGAAVLLVLAGVAGHGPMSGRGGVTTAEPPAAADEPAPAAGSGAGLAPATAPARPTSPQGQISASPPGPSAGASGAARPAPTAPVSQGDGATSSQAAAGAQARSAPAPSNDASPSPGAAAARHLVDIRLGSITVTLL